MKMILFLTHMRYYRLLYKPKFRTKKRYLKIKYVIANIFEQIHAVVPLTLYVILFQYPITTKNKKKTNKEIQKYNIIPYFDILPIRGDGCSDA